MLGLFKEQRDIHYGLTPVVREGHRDKIRDGPGAIVWDGGVLKGQNLMCILSCTRD